MFIINTNGSKIKTTNEKTNTELLKYSETLKIKPMYKTAKTVTIAPKEEDFLYIRNRAVSAGNVIPQPDGSAISVPIDEYYKDFEKYSKICRNANSNGDFFSEEELKKKYKTFIGKSAFVDHDNENVEKARGIILDAVYNNKEFSKTIDATFFGNDATAGFDKNWVQMLEMNEISIAPGTKEKVELNIMKY